MQIDSALLLSEKWTENIHGQRKKSSFSAAEKERRLERQENAEVGEKIKQAKQEKPEFLQSRILENR